MIKMFKKNIHTVQDIKDESAQVVSAFLSVIEDIHTINTEIESKMNDNQEEIQDILTRAKMLKKENNELSRIRLKNKNQIAKIEDNLLV